MTYFTSWEEFVRACERLYAASPNQCRFVTKYSHHDAKMVLKLTDDVVCLQFATDQAADVKRLDKLTAMMMRSMVNKEHA